MASSDPHDNNNQRDNNFGKGYALGSAATSSNNNNNNNNNENVASSQSSSSPLTKEQLREQRLKRLSNSGTAVTPKLAPPSLNVASLIKDPPPAKSLSDPHEPLPAFSFHNNDDDYAEDSDLQAAIALSMGKTSSVDETPPSTTSLLTSQASNYSNNNNITYQDQEDAELQAALALSLGIVNHPQSASNVSFYTPNAASTATTPMDIDGDDHGQDDDRKMPAKPELPPPPSVPNPLHFSGRVRKWYTRPNPTPMADIHHILWDTTITTLQDQQRWVSQGIQFKQQQQQVPDNETTTASRENLESSSLVATVVANHQEWGLTQEHGGPCGVLAAIQSELLRVLIFGDRTTHPLSMIPVQVPNDIDEMQDATTTTTSPLLTPLLLQQTLALSMGIILARAAMQPSASAQGEIAETRATTWEIQIVLPKAELWGGVIANLDWMHYEPWPGNVITGAGMSEHLVTYSISIGNPSGTEMDAAAAAAAEDQVAKRQKRGDDTTSLDNSIDDTDVNELAHAVAQFLLETNAMSWFLRPGGVLLFLLSLVQTRTIPTLQSDMDDATAKLTSNFGHCSQELINLLLTGQSVSNVFDNTLSPSGELVCRGIQTRPAIGYLSQLEAMRYLEVGGHYKRPRFPIWIVGSSSHFSVMFGEEAAIQESSSDALLEKVRRTFKGMEGGAEENGFIQTGQLGTFFNAVGLERLTEHEVQMLCATMEAYGAGIILWEELWKKTSRLLTGASVQSVLQDSGNSGTSTPPPPLSESDPISKNSSFDAAAAATSDAPMTDEELARLLQAELNGGVVDLTAIGGSDGVAVSCTNATTSDTASTTAVAAPEFPEALVSGTQYGHTFEMYHYNGLRGGKLRKFRVTRLNADEAIGASVPLGVSQHHHTMASMGGDLEDVLRTKWPSCKVDWLGGSPPSID